ncbi:5'-nucleotidase domain-containing protein 1-like [Branchiostoma floridae x Branchiostoma japonicum]
MGQMFTTVTPDPPNTAKMADAGQTFSFADVDAVGLDLDHTLCRYKVAETFEMIYDGMSRYVVEELKYGKEDMLRPFSEDRDFCIKGLLLDALRGNFLKFAEDGTILRASHGTKKMTEEEIVATYGEEKQWKHFAELKGKFENSDKYHLYENYFDMPGIVLCARMVDNLEKQAGGKQKTKMCKMWRDAIDAFNNAYKPEAFAAHTGGYFPGIKDEPYTYMHKCSEDIRRWLKELRSAGKAIFLATSSCSDYCDYIARKVLGDEWKDYFDVIVTNSKKPGFFSEPPNRRPFYSVVDFQEGTKVKELERGKGYAQGNWQTLMILLRQLTGKEEPKVVYIGDSLRSDIFPPKKFANWSTVLICEEMEAEGMEEDRTQNGPATKRARHSGNDYDPASRAILVSDMWGPFLTDRSTSGSEVVTVCGHILRSSADICVPHLEYLAALPLDHKFTTFKDSSSEWAGFHPGKPRSLRK